MPHTLASSLPLDDLRARYEKLQANMANFSTIQQELINTRDRLDREVARFAAIHNYNTRAIGIQSDGEFAEFTAETVIDVFELEVAAIWRAEPQDARLVPSAVVGLELDQIPADVVSRWWATLGLTTGAGPSDTQSQKMERLRGANRGRGGGSNAAPAVRILAADDPELAALGFHQLVIGHCLGLDGRPVGLLIAGSTQDQGTFYDPFTEEHLQSFTVFTQQVGALLQSRHDRALIQRQLEALRISEERLAQSLDGGGMGLWDWNLATQSIYFSDRWLSMLGYGPGELPPTVETWRSLMHPDEAKEVIGRVTTYIRAPTEAGYQNEHRLRCKDGRWAWILARGKVLLDARGRPTRMVGVHVDITDRKATEEALRHAGEEQRKARREAEEANQAKSSFLAAMSHEIRTPMNGVLGMLQLINGTTLTAEQRGLAETAQHSALALLAIINDILDLSKVEAGKLELEAIAFNPTDTIEDVTRLLDSRAQERGLRVHRHLDGSLPARLRGDPGRFRQVLTNLLGNAIKFTEQGEIHVEAHWREEPDGGRLFVAVRDTGIGISEEAMSRLFSPFSQADSSTTRRFGGTGLGLAISRRLVELMGGQISAESALGTGSIFRFNLRADRVDEAPIVVPAPAPEPSPVGLPAHIPHVLVAEDNPVNQMVISLMLKRLGFTATIAADGEQALRHLSESTFDLVLMDMQMPVMDGLQATRSLRARETAAGAPRLPVIALTANAMAQSRDECFAAGMDDFLPKPIRFEELQALLLRWLA